MITIINNNLVRSIIHHSPTPNYQTTLSLFLYLIQLSFPSISYTHTVHLLHIDITIISSQKKNTYYYSQISNWSLMYEVDSNGYLIFY